MRERTKPAEGLSAGGGANPTWRGRVEDVAEPVKHNWQRDEADHPAARSQLRTQWRRLRLAAMLLLLGAFLGLFAYYLLFAPAQTPVYAVAATTYDIPFSPNAWAWEDLNGLLDLHGKTLDVRDMTATWSNRRDALTALDRQLKQLAREGTRSSSVLLSLSLHGAVDEKGAPCLIPPGASPLDSQTWLPVEAVLRTIADQTALKSHRIILLLDANRTRDNWSVGIFENGFAEGLRRLTETTPLPPNVWILNSANSGQVGWASNELQGSVFGHFLRMGLAGAADHADEGGNDDRRISLGELHAYLSRHVNAWALKHRGVPQQPLLLGASKTDVTVTWALNDPHRDAIAQSSPATRSATPESAIAKLWESYEEWTTRQLVSSDPLAWHRLGRELLWLEEATQAGGAYEAMADTGFTRVRALFARMAEASQDDSAAPAARGLRTAAEIESGRVFDAGGSLTLRTAPLASRLDGTRSVIAPQPSSVEPSGATDLTGRGRLTTERDHLAQILRQEASRRNINGEAIPGVLALQDQADRSAVPEDERTVRWIDPLLSDADGLRRRAWDELFLGRLTGSPTLDQAQRAYRTTQDRASVAAEALRDRDAALADWIGLARWTAAARMQDTAAAETTRQLNAVLLPLLRNLRQLERKLTAADVPGADVADDALPFLRERDEVAAAHAELRRQFNAEYERLLTAKRYDVAAVQEMFALLQVPLLPDENSVYGWTGAEQRNRLRTHLANAFTHLQAANDVKNDAAEKPAAADAPASSGPQWEQIVVDWENHPALALLETSATSDPPPAGPRALDDTFDAYLEVARIGSRVREHLKKLPAELSRTRDSAAATVPAYREALCRNESRTRSAASLSPITFDVDPVGVLRRFELQQLVLAHARRALDDFLGPADVSGRPLFQMVVPEYLEAARTIDAAMPTLARQSQAIQELLGGRLRAAHQGLRTVADSVLLVDPNEPVEIRAAVTPGPAAAWQSLPAGTAALVLREAGRRIDKAVQAVPVGDAQSVGETNATAAGEALFSLPGRSLAGGDETLTALTVFRGNEYPSRFQLMTAGGVEVVHVPESFDTAQVTLNEALRKSRSLVFVLDCSWSMTETVRIEGSREPLPRFDVAANALQRMLDQLAQRRDVRVGVILYGHRVGYSQRPRVKLFQERYRKLWPFEESLEPYEDVEPVLPLGRFGAEQASDVAGRLELIEPLGQTPLYYATLAGLREFDRDPAGTERTVIVVTDGLNDVSNPPADKAVTASQVAQAAQKQNASIYIVGFQLAARDRVQAQQEFTSLTRRTGGQYVAATEATGLIRSLEELVSPSEYHVRPAQGREQTAEVRTPVTIDGLLAGRRQVTVSVEQVRDQVELAGGESLELLVAPEGKGLETVPYRTRAVQSAPLVAGTLQEPTGFQLWAHDPVQRNDGVEFELSIQHARNRFSRRPLEVWLEITPVVPAGTERSEPYVFYDPNFVPGTSVPVLRYLARDWPAAARSAEIRCWAKYSETPPTASIPVHKLAGQLPETGDPLNELDGALVQVRTHAGNPYRLVVIERETSSGPEGGALKVELAGTVQPREIHRRTDARHRVAIHTFEFDPADAEAVGLANLLITRRRDALDGAWSIPRPLVIDIGGSGGLMPLTLPPITATDSR